MPLLYGEGQRAFYRLQEQIIRDSGDDSILAWDHQHQYNRIGSPESLLAPSPNYFRDCRHVSHCRPISWDDAIDLTNNGLRLKTHYLTGLALKQLHRLGPNSRRAEVALLNCYREDAPDLRIALRLQRYIQQGSSGEKAYFVYSGIPGTIKSRGTATEGMAGPHTRLVLIDRSGGQSSVARETNLITRTMLDQQPKYHLNITVNSEDQVVFDKVLQLSQSPENKPPQPWTDSTSDSISSQAFEVVTGDTWSATVLATSQAKCIVGGAKLQHYASKQTFFLLCTYLNPYVLPESANDGEYGVKLLYVLDKTGDHPPSDAASTESDVNLFMASRPTDCRGLLKAKKSVLKLHGVGTVTALANVSGFEGLMMNVTIIFTAKGESPSKQIESRAIWTGMRHRLSKLKLGS